MKSNVSIIRIITTIVHRSDEKHLILQVALQQPHLFFFDAPTTALLAPTQRLFLPSPAADSAEAELRGADQREGGAEERQ